MPLTVNDSGVLRTLGSFPANDDGIIREQNPVVVSDDGVLRTVYSSGTKISDLNVGDVIQIKENGVPVNYIVIHKGLPSSMYDASCDGVWVLRQSPCSERMIWNDKNAAYANSSVHAWLNNDFIYTIDPEVRAKIKTVKIPVGRGSADLSCKAFLLSGCEVGSFVEEDEEKTLPTDDGTRLSYFKYNTDLRYLENGWLRSYGVSYGTVWYVYGGIRLESSSISIYYKYFVSPVFILPHNFKI